MKTLVSLMALVGALGLVVGCTESDEEAAQTPEGAATVENTAVQTDDEGNTIEAPATAGGEAVPPQEEEGQQTAPGDAEAGQQVFAANCTTCHLNDGQEGGGVGPQLAGQGLEEDLIRETIENGRGAMPGGLVSGEDLDNAVAYVLSLQ